MAEDDFKFSVDMTRVKNSKLYSKFVKSIETGKRDDSKEVMAPAAPATSTATAGKIEKPKQDRLQENEAERNTLVKYPEVFGFGHTTPPQFAQQSFKKEEAKYQGSPSREQLPVKSNPVEGRENRRGGTFRAEFGNRDNDVMQQQTANFKQNLLQGQPVGQNTMPAVQQQQVFHLPQQQYNFHTASQSEYPAPQPQYPSQQIFPSQNYQPQPPITIPTISRPQQAQIQVQSPSAPLPSPIPTLVSNPSNPSSAQLSTLSHQQLAKQYKSKLDKLALAYQQLKTTSMNQNRQRKSQLISYQQIIQTLKQKVYEVQMKQDQLTLQTQRLKQKISTQTVIKTRLQQDNKQLTYQLQQLKDMLQNKQSSVRKKTDEVTYWKSQCESLKSQLQNIKLSNDKLSNSLRQFEEERQFLRREMQNKEALQSDLKEKVSVLLRENAKVRDELHFVGSRVTDLEHENYSLRTDLKREAGGTGAGEGGLQAYMKREREVGRGDGDLGMGQQQQQQPTRRRGQFNKQRQKANQGRQPRGQFRQFQNYRGGTTTNPPNTNYSSSRNQPPPQLSIDHQIQQLIQKSNSLESQVQKMRDIKAMNGATRKRKIDMEREIEAIQKKIRELRGEEEK